RDDLFERGLVGGEEEEVRRRLPRLEVALDEHVAQARAAIFLELEEARAAALAELVRLLGEHEQRRDGRAEDGVGAIGERVDERLDGLRAAGAPEQGDDTAAHESISEERRELSIGHHGAE